MDSDRSIIAKGFAFTQTRFQYEIQQRVTFSKISGVEGSITPECRSNYFTPSGLLSCHHCIVPHAAFHFLLFCSHSASTENFKLRLVSHIGDLGLGGGLGNHFTEIRLCWNGEGPDTSVCCKVECDKAPHLSPSWSQTLYRSRAHVQYRRWSDSPCSQCGFKNSGNSGQNDQSRGPACSGVLPLLF